MLNVYFESFRRFKPFCHVSNNRRFRREVVNMFINIKVIKPKTCPTSRCKRVYQHGSCQTKDVSRVRGVSLNFNLLDGNKFGRHRREVVNIFTKKVVNSFTLNNA